MSEDILYTCAYCGGQFVDDTPLEEMIAETERKTGMPVDPDDIDIICDDCFTVVQTLLQAMTHEHPHAPPFVKTA